MRFIFSFTLLILPLLLFAQPANDDCSNVIPVNIDDCLVYDNMNANSDVGFVNFNPPGLTCNPTANEVWFSFTGPAAGGDGLLVTVTGVADGAIPALNQPSVAVLLGDCPSMFMEAISCQEAAAGSNTVEFVLSGASLIPGFPYYVVVSGWSSTATLNEGAFEFCVETYELPADICSGSPATITDCSGMITDSGGDSGDYSSNENCVFTIDPTTFNACIIVNVNFYDVENFSDFINFYDGPTTGSPQIQSLSGVGANVEVQASSGSLTIEFISDGFVESSGFEIEWTCTTDECTVLGPIDVESMVSIDDLVDALSSPQVVVENPVLNCPDGGYGTYTSPGNSQLDVMGLGQGIILSTGLAEDVENAENFFASQPFNSPGDPDLDALSTGASTNDACVLEFDVYAATDELLFQYVFGSEEYPNFVNSNFNDIFAFFISGPGVGTNVNIAVLGDGVTPVEINTVNDVNPGAQFDPVTGEVIYNNNAGGLSLPYGGYTSVLTAKADVIPCNYYHLKLAIADRGDAAYDSGVFIADLQAGLPELNLVFEINSTTGENVLVEGCSDNDFISATLTNPDPTDTIVYYLHVEGVADENLDLVTPIPDSLLAPPGETIIQIPIIPSVDMLAEGVESFGLQVFGVFQCDTVVYDSVTILIYDEIDIEPSQDTFFVCTGTSVQLEVGGATGYTWGWPIPSELNNPNLYNPNLTPSQSGTIYVSGIINGNSNCVDTDSAYIQIIDPTITVVTPPPFICENESVQLVATTNTNDTGISWSPSTGLSCIDCPNPIATPPSTITYTSTVTAGGCTETAEIIVTVDPLGIPSLIGETLICEGSSIILATAPTGTGAAVTSHLWSPDNGSLDDLTSPSPNATPANTTTYTVVSTSANGACSNTQSVTINVAPASISIDGPDTIYQCNDALNPMTLNTTSISMPGDIVWSDNNGGTYPNGGSLSINPSENIIYYATISIGLCTNYDSVVIQIDSIPDFILDVSVPSQGIALTNPDTVDVCSDSNESFFVTNLYNTALYPELNHEWLINGTSYSPTQGGANLLDNLPLSISNYVLVSNNNACSSLDSFVIDVNTPPNFAISPTSATICPGDNVQLEATGTTDFIWVPDDGSLSDININNPIATPSQTTTYTAYTDIAGCQAGVSTTITVLETPSISLVSGLTICSGEQRVLGLGASNPNFTYTWSPSDFVSGNGTANPIAAPLVTTTYSVTVSNGVCDTIGNVTITVNNELPLVVTGDPNICLGESTTLSANTQGAVNWFDTSGTLIASGPTLVLTPTVVGSTIVTAQAFNNFCSASENFAVNVALAPTLSVSDSQSICAGEPVDISAITNIGTLTWVPGNEFSDPTLAMQTVSPSGTTTYTVTADNNGCEVSDNVTINVFDAPIYGVRDDITICLGESISIGLLNDTNTSYAWTSNPADPSLIDTGIGNPVASPNTTTTYTLTASNGLCVETDQMTITVINSNFILENDTICPGESAMLVASPSTQGGIVTWSDWEGTVLTSGNTLTVSPLVSTSYSASHDFDGCMTTIIGSVIVLEGPATNIAATVTQVLAGESTTLTLSGAPAGSTLVWTDLVTDIDLPETTATITVTPEVTTDYLVSITTANGCVYEDLIHIDVLLQELKMPNIFTPNGDGTNDEFYPIFSDLSLDLLEFKVFDRWGELVHDGISSGWDGKFKDKKLPSDIYVYFLRIRFNDGTEQFQKGDVALMR